MNSQITDVHVNIVNELLRFYLLHVTLTNINKYWLHNNNKWQMYCSLLVNIS